MTANLFLRIAAAVPDPGKIVLDAADGRKLSFGWVMEETARVANAIAARGVTPGDRVAVQVEKSPEALVLYLACLRAGAIYLPLNTGYTEAELAYFIGDAEPRLVVCDPSSAESLGPMAGKVGAAVATLAADGTGTLSDLAATQSAECPVAHCWPDDVAAILYTSGTTGRSKGAMLTHANLTSNALTLVDYWRFTAADVLIHALPIYHTHGLFVATNTILLAGGSMIFQPRFDVTDILDAMPRATALMGVPTFYTRLLAHPGLTREATRHMRLFISGSAPLLAETHRAFAERTGQQILERYGMTETNMITSNPYAGDRVAGTVGFPLPGVSLRIADPEGGGEHPPGEVGVIEVKGPNVFSGYWRMPDKTAADFRADGWFITGDFGIVDDRGYVSIVGRAKDLVISGGFNIYPKEVESEIDALPGIVESAVIGVPHPDFGEAVVAVVVGRDGAVLDEKAILDPLKDRLARFKQPKRVIVVRELPRNTMGKVQKNVLRERYGRLFSD